MNKIITISITIIVIIHVAIIISVMISGIQGCDLEAHVAVAVPQDTRHADGPGAYCNLT